MAYEYSRTIKQIHQLVEDGIAPGFSYAIFDGQSIVERQADVDMNEFMNLIKEELKK